nr:hypothetical protein B0A51_07280 [Rachicladosporium sp. CCFEE 5018]
MASARRGTPKITYGKKRPALLPLTAEQFRRSSIFEIPAEETEAQRRLPNVDQCAKHRVTAEDSQLSDAESSEEVSSTPVYDVAEATKASLSESRSRAAPRKSLKFASVSDVRPTDAPGRPSAASQHLHASPRRRVRRPIAPERHSPLNSLPNELLLVPMQLLKGSGTSLLPAKPHIGFSFSLANDSVTSDNRYYDDDHGAGVAEDAPAVFRPKSGLTTHRKRLKTTMREHKTIRELQSKQEAGVNEPSHILPGDGFEKSELKVAHRLRLKVRHRRKRRTEPLWQGFQELTLYAEAADEPEFLRAPVKNEPILGQTGTLALSANRPRAETESFADSDMISHDPGEIKLPTAGPSAMSRQQELIAIELSSLSAPVRQYSVSVCSDEEAEEDGVDDGAAESYVDHEDIAEDAIEDVVEVESDPQEVDASAEDAGDGAFIVDFRSSHLRGNPGLMRCPSRRNLMEVNETIFDDPNAYPDKDIMLDDAQISIASPTGQRLPQPRSILKCSTVTRMPIEAGPELTARNTRRNSRIPTTRSTHFSSPPPSSDPDSELMLDEESRYFTSAQQQLAASPAQPRSIIRKKSNNPQVGYTYGDATDVQVPYSGSLTVVETSPIRQRFSDESQLRILKCGGDVVWQAERDVREVEQNLGRLTRRVSMEHGTLSRGSRRRRSIAFDAEEE